MKQNLEHINISNLDKIVNEEGIVTLELDEDKNIYNHYALVLTESSEPHYKKQEKNLFFNNILQQFNKIIEKIID